MKQFLFFLPMLTLFLTTSCSKTAEPKRKGLNLFYVVLDKSSNSFSHLGGEDENFIDVDTTYLGSLIDTLYYKVNACEEKNDLALFFTYIDREADGNKEIYFKIPAFEKIDTHYASKTGQVLSTEEGFKEELKRKQEQRAKDVLQFQSEKHQLLVKLNDLLLKSKEAKGSDCSGTLLTASRKLDNIWEDKEKVNVKNKVIITFSDLVNFPQNETPITIDYKIIRPGFTSEVPYLKSNQYVNITSQNEFQEIIFNLLNN